jgi:endonuclease I
MKKIFLHFIFLLAIFCLQPLLHAQPPAGYYDAANGQSGENLKAALHNIIKNHTTKSYDYLWTAFQTTDDKTNGKVWDMYSDIPGGTPIYEYTFGSDQCGNYNSEGDCYNREHSFPGSWFNDASPMYSDLFHLVPTDGWVNNKRGSYPFGETENATYTSSNGSKLGPCSVSGYSGVVFEPIDEYKGDFARNYFYMATRYLGEDGSWPGSPMVQGAEPKPWALIMLGEWHTSDPVSPKEIDRNNAIYAIQNNRNPFIDHPEFVYKIWSVGAGLAAEPVQHVSNFSAHCITLSWTDATGDMQPESYLVRMSSTGFSNIQIPLDGISVSDDSFNINVDYGVGTCTFGSLEPGATYYFKIFGYTGSGATIDYKIDGTVQQVSIEAR